MVGQRRNVRHTLTGAALAAALAWSGAAIAQQPASAPDVTPTVIALLEGAETEPAPEDWTRLGPSAVPILVTTLQDKSLLVAKRGRAATALQHFPTPEAAQALRDVLVAEKMPKLLRRKAMHALAKIQGEQALPVLEPYLSNESSRLREAAIKAVGDVGTLRAQDLLRARLKVETSTYLKETLQRLAAKPPRQPLAEPATTTDAPTVVSRETTK